MGHVSFRGLSLLTAPGRVMTPRPATEELVGVALERLRGRPAGVVDVGTGSGALAVAIATAAPQARVWATDTSRCAVALARANVRRYGLEDRITVLLGDLLEPVPCPVDLIVANLPYLPVAAADASPELSGEPDAALFAPGDGLGPYRRLIAAAAERLTAEGALVIQLHRRVLAADRDELALLRAQLVPVPSRVSRPRPPLAVASAA